MLQSLGALTLPDELVDTDGFLRERGSHCLFIVCPLLRSLEIMEECCLLACSPWLVPLVFYTTQDHLPMNGTTHSGLSPPISIINQENASHAGLTNSLKEAFLNLFPDDLPCLGLISKVPGPAREMLQG